MQYDKKKRIITYSDPVHDDFANLHIDSKKTKDDYKYVGHNKVRNFFGNLLYFLIGVPIIHLIIWIGWGVKLKNKKVIKKVKDTGFFIYGVHTSILTDATVNQVAFSPFRRSYIVCNPDAFSIHPVIAGIVKILGGYPVPSNLLQSKHFVDGMKELLEKKRSFVIYPEAHIWPYYTGVREYSDASFVYPVMFKKPIIASATTYRQRKLFKNGKPLITVTYSEPIYPRDDLSPKENQKYLRDEAIKFQKKIVSDPNNYAYITYKYLPRE